MTGYELWKLLHIVAAALWVGADVTMSAQSTYLARRGDVAGLLRLNELDNWFGPRVLAPTAAVVVITGSLTVLSSDALAFSDPFVVIGLGGVVVGFAVGMGLAVPRLQRYSALAEAEGHDAPGLEPLRREIERLTRFNTVLLVFVVFVMVTRPEWW